MRPLPDFIEIGIDTTKPNLLERRKDWNKTAPAEYALPTEIWREVVERRQRYCSIREKIKKGEIHDINDFITYNLDIQQFAQDAIARYEGSDFINVMYTAIAGRKPLKSNHEYKPGITILDPTCGSGAFLFAALNILEPLYEGCIRRMKEFTEDADAKNQKTKYPQFRQVLQDIDHHPNLQYYIYKSIILNNLYGVDIMKEAVEIAKLRLFLKLVASVKEPDYKQANMGIEPLPDIDFNIRPGNTLVGFATEKQLTDGLKYSIDGIEFLPNIQIHCDVVAKTFARYKEIQLRHDEDFEGFKKAKEELIEKLKALNTELNVILHKQYASIQYQQWLINYKPFHWFAEFYEIIQNGGFDVVIGNPPYVEYSKIRKQYNIKGYNTEKTGNLYVFVVERSFYILKKIGMLGIIVPVSSIATERMLPYVNILKSKRTWNSFYAERPSKLFTGAEVQLVITIFQSIKFPQTFTTSYLKWEAEKREFIFQLLGYNETSNSAIDKSIPKIGTRLQHSIINKIFKTDNKLKNYKRSNTKYYISYRNAGGRYYKICLNYEPKFISNGVEKRSSTYQLFYTINKHYRDAICAIMNSTTFFWYWQILSDTWHMLSREIDDFGIDISDELIKKLEQHTINLLVSLKSNSKVIIEYRNKGNDKIELQKFSARDSKPIIDEIDKVLAQHYGFTEEELDFIINYDIKYRMGGEPDEE